MKTLGQKIRELREAKDLSLRELAKQLEVSAAFLSDIELSRRFPSDKVLGSMARLLGTSLEDLRGYDARFPIEDMKRMAIDDPRLGLAFRKVIDKNISSEDLLKFIEGKSKSPKKK